VHVVDLYPDPIVNRLAALDVAAVAEPGSLSAAEQHVTAYCEQISRATVADLPVVQSPFADGPLMVVWGTDLYSVVVAVSPAAAGVAVVLTVQEPVQWRAAVAVRQLTGAALPTLSDVLAVTPPDGFFVAARSRLPRTELLDRVGEVSDFGYGTGHWNVFLPSAGYSGLTRLAVPTWWCDRYLRRVPWRCLASTYTSPSKWPSFDRLEVSDGVPVVLPLLVEDHMKAFPNR